MGVGPYASMGNQAPTVMRPPAPRRAVPGQAGNPWAYVPGTGPKPKGATTTKATTTSKPPVDPWAALLAQIQGSFETPAQMEVRVNREINAQIAAQKKLIDDTYEQQRADAMAQMQAQSLAGAAAAALNKDLFNAVGGEFNAAAGEIKGLAHGLSQNAQGATAGDVSRANAALGALGNAPVTEGGTFGVGGGTQQGVEEYRGGTLPGQMLSTQGEAANFGLAGMIGAQALQATQEGQAALMTAMKDIRNNQAKAVDALAAGRADLYHQYMSDAKDSQIKYISLAQGLMAAKQAQQSDAVKLKLTQQQNAWNRYIQAMRENRLQKDMTFDQWLGTTKEGRLAAGQAFNQGATTTRLNQEQTRVQIAQANAARQIAKDALAAGQVDVNKSKAQGIVVDKTGTPIRDAQGKPIPASTLATKKAPSATTVAKAGNLIKEWFYGYRSVPSSSAKNAPLKRIPAYQAPDFDPNDPRTFGKGFTTYPKALAQLTRMGFGRDTARNMLNEYWERGDHGRPIFSTEEQNAIRAKFGKSEYERMVLQIRRALDRGSIDQAEAWIAQVLQGRSFHPGYTGSSTFGG